MLKHYIEQLLAVWSIIRQISKCRNSIAELLMSDLKQFKKLKIGRTLTLLITRLNNLESAKKYLEVSRYIPVARMSSKIISAL